MKISNHQQNHRWPRILSSFLVVGMLVLLVLFNNHAQAERVEDMAPSETTSETSQPVQTGSPSSSIQATTQVMSQDTIADMHLNIWPEYDDPRVLVMVGGDFEDKANYPRKFSFMAPKEADINSTCSLTTDSTHLSQLYTVNKLENGQEISFNMPEPRFHYEYYYNAFDPLSEGSQKSFEYTFTAPYPIKKLAVEIQEPLKATNFSIIPESPKSSNDAKGFKYYHYEYSNLQAGQTVTFKVDYLKTDPAPSVKKEKYNPGQANFGGPSGNKNVIIILSVIMAVVLALGGYWIISSKRPAPQFASSITPRNLPSQRSGKRNNGKGSGGGSGGSRFCAECGMRLAATSKFCASCGTRVRN